MLDGIIWTNNALEKLKELGLSEEYVLDAFKKGQVEKTGGKGNYGRWNAVKKYRGYEIGVNYDRRPDGRWVIISVWKRNRR